MLQVGGWSTDLQMFSTNVRCLNLQLSSCDEEFADSGNIDSVLCRQMIGNRAY